MKKICPYIKIFLPILFILYVGCLVAFTHVHIVDGVTIVHSHPYKKGVAGEADHEHDYAEFQLLHQLSAIETLLSGLAAILLAFLVTGTILYTIFPVYPDYLVPARGTLSLRAPPAHSFHS